MISDNSKTMRYVFNNLISCILLLGITYLVSTYRKSRKRVSVLGIENTLSSREPTDSTVEQERRPSMEVYSQMSDMTTTTECLPPSNFKVQTGNLAEIDTSYTNDIGNDLKQKSQRHECITNNCCSSLSPKTKNNKKMWTLEEDKLLIEKLLHEQEGSMVFFVFSISVTVVWISFACGTISVPSCRRKN